MYASFFGSWLNAMSAWGPGLPALALILLAAQRAWVAYLKLRGADYVRAQAVYLAAQAEPAIRLHELNILDRMIELGRLSLETRRAEIALEERLAAARHEAEAPADTAAPAKKAA